MPSCDSILWRGYLGQLQADAGHSNESELSTWFDAQHRAAGQGVFSLYGGSVEELK